MEPVGTTFATFAGAMAVVAFGGWLWSRRMQPMIDERTRDRLAPRTPRVGN